MHGPDIARSYIKGWLILDVLASIPLDVVVLGGNRCALSPRALLKVKPVTHAASVHWAASVQQVVYTLTLYNFLFFGFRTLMKLPRLLKILRLSRLLRLLRYILAILASPIDCMKLGVISTSIVQA